MTKLHLEIAVFNNNVDSVDPFKGLLFPSGATGLVLNICGYTFGRCAKGFYYVFRKVIQSRDYVQRNGEQKTGVTGEFYDIFWKFDSLSDARWFVKAIIAERKHYLQLLNIKEEKEDEEEVRYSL